MRDSHSRMCAHAGWGRVPINPIVPSGRIQAGRTWCVEIQHAAFGSLPRSEVLDDEAAVVIEVELALARKVREEVEALHRREAARGSDIVGPVVVCLGWPVGFAYERLRAVPVWVHQGRACGCGLGSGGLVAQCSYRHDTGDKEVQHGESQAHDGDDFACEKFAWGVG